MTETKLTCYGGVGSVTGANFLLEISDKRVLVDCGMAQGSREAGERNHRNFAYDPSSIDVLFITHAHIDHTGLVPKLVKDGFRGEIYSTPETKSIAELLLRDSASINAEKDVPLYRATDVEHALSLWKTLPYHEMRTLGDFSVEFFDAGHVLGSAMVKFTLPSGKTMLFSGDLGNPPSTLLKETERVPGIDYLLMESVYGDRNHEDVEERTEKLKKVVRDTMERRGTLLIPVFSLERTQVILYELDNLFESGALPEIPVFLDSPLAIKITNIYENVTKYYNEEVQKELQAGDEIFRFERLRQIAQARDSRKIGDVKGPKIILAGAGMSTGGRIMAHEAEYLPGSNNTILFVGYQAPGTPGRQIADGLKRVVIGEKEVEVRARVEMIHGFSAHADSDALVKFVEPNKGSLKKVFVAMGEPGVSSFLAQRLRDELGVEALVPEKTKIYILD